MVLRGEREREALVEEVLKEKKQRRERERGGSFLESLTGTAMGGRRWKFINELNKRVHFKFMRKTCLPITASDPLAANLCSWPQYFA